MTSWPENTGWHLQLDNPDFRGWSVVAAYVMAAACCARAARARRQTGPEERRLAVIWWLLAFGLLFLGINKQLNLQTLLIDLGRQAARAGGWYARDKARLAQMIFSVAFVLAGLAAFGFVLARFRRFFARNPWALTGVVVLLLFVLIRAASINHLLERGGLNQDDKRWTWLLEIGGSACLALAALQARKQNDAGKQR
jgi:hypothetical protein